MSRYRAEWISTLLRQGTRLTVEDMKRMHYDRYSLQAKAFMEIIHPLLPHSENGDILREWDLRYEADSPGATLFERIHHELLTLVFFDHDPGSGGIDYLLEETPVFAMAHGNFDDVLLSESSAWFDEKPREEWYKEAIERGLKGKALRHGTARKIYIENLFFGGKLPGCLGFDYPLEHIGSCSTIPQAQLFTLNGRPSTFAATLRLICDFADETLHANVAGGASDRRFSRYYKAGLREWENGDYDSLTPKSDDGVNDTERIQ
jgi:penicillin amidase